MLLPQDAVTVQIEAAAAAMERLRQAVAPAVGAEVVVARLPQRRVPCYPLIAALRRR